ncbi:DUF2603 domain-containing protein [Helicobacter suis]|uniref:DUF2603 domain-containing protein n=1 Tax=Helicobacter suis TaxID=104628 RepID=UPI0022074BFC|nr:DUF2603 domain-containing protein [Helicobacter suis]BDR28598.1 hypothetical protein HSHS1_13590 [Helicobacter suis HS1]
MQSSRSGKSRGNKTHLNEPADMQEIYQSLESGKNRVQAKLLSPKQMLLELEEGDFNTKEAWFVKDDQDQKYVVIPESLLQYIVRMIQKAYEDKVIVELERDMATLTPIDFADAMAVVFKKLEAMRGSVLSLPKISLKWRFKRSKAWQKRVIFPFTRKSFLQTYKGLITPQNPLDTNTPPRKVGIFIGCLSNYNYTEVGQSLLSLLDKLNISALIPEQFC